MSSRRSIVASFLVLASLPACAGGQEARGARSAGGSSPVESITEADVRRRVEIIAHDSMGGRNTPSPGLEKTAAYIASEFRRLGLRPAGDDGSYVQRYVLERVLLDAKRTAVSLSSGTERVDATAQREVLYVSGRRTGLPVSGRPLLMGGTLDSASIARAPVAGRIVLLVWGKRDAALTARNRALMALVRGRPSAVVLVSDGDSANFARQVAAQQAARFAFGVGASGGPPIVSVQERSVARVLGAAQTELAAVRSAPSLVVRELSTVDATVSVRDLPGEAPSAPNVVGIVEGSDPALRDEYVIFSAHMDHVGTAPRASKDSIWNGADDDASGTAGVLELAEAFARPAARTRRSMIFLLVSGEEKGLWGSAHFAEQMPVPASQVVANVNIDMIGRNWRDTIVAIGKSHSDLGATLDRVAREHPELRMTPIDDPWPNENFYFRSDHYNFARRGIPVLFFFNGTHTDYHQPSDSPEKIDAEKEARIVRLLYHLGAAIGNAPERPKWKRESYDRIVQ